MQHLEVSSVPVLYIGRTVPKVKKSKSHIYYVIRNFSDVSFTTSLYIKPKKYLR